MTPFKKPPTVRTSAAIIGSNDDLLAEFLLFLPAKSLIRFQLVSKQWRFVISSPSFRHLHTLHHRRRRRCSKPRPSFLLRATGSQFLICHPTARRLVPFRFKSPFVRTLQSCNGLLLLESRNYPNGPRSFEILNPTTMQSRQLRPPKAFVGLCLVFDPSKSPHYKVVCFIGREPFSTRSLAVYDSKTHTWKDGYKSDVGRNNFWNGVYWKDGIYFVKYHHKSRCLSLEDGKVFVFDKPPRIESPGAQKYHIVESNGHLHCVLLFLGTDEKYLNVYELSSVDHSWFTKYCVGLDPIIGKDINLLGLMRGEREEDSILLLHVPGKIVMYGIATEVFEVVFDFGTERYFGEGGMQFKFEDAHQFIETLAPV